MKVTTVRTASFGPYALDLRSGELRKFGTKVKMGEQPFQILLILLERPGEMVTREEIRDKLWTDDTFVDFDHGLNSAVQRLRDCLSDSAGKPRWIETLPRRGYRFVGEVQWTRRKASRFDPITGRLTAGKSFRRSRPGLLRRRHDRRTHHHAGEESKPARRLAYVGNAVQKSTPSAAR